MRIKSVECEQFAGLNDKKVEFENGLNIIVGANESGKSTVVDLIFQLLFKDAKIDGRSDSDFVERYFPKKIGGTQADFIDGVIVFETPNGTYKLKKEWEKGEGICKLTLPEKTSIKGVKEIKKQLNEVLKHRAGVYDEIVFASQKRNQTAVESIMRTLGKKKDDLLSTREDLASTLTQAALETGGVSIERLEKRIDKNMEDLIGRWNWNVNAPEKSPKYDSYKTPWKNGVGDICKAYYEMDEVRSMQKYAEETERDVDEEKTIIQELKSEKKIAEDTRATFQKFRVSINNRKYLNGEISRLERDIKQMENADANWHKYQNELNQANRLKEEREQAQIHGLYVRVKDERKLYLEKEKELEKLQKVNKEDLDNLKELSTNKEKEEIKLSGMNIVAKIKKTGSKEIKVTSVSSGKELDLCEGDIQITEAVNITIPDILDMQLMPQGVDVDKVKENIENYNREIKKIYDKYKVRSYDELEKSYSNYNTLYLELRQKSKDVDSILGDITWEELEKRNKEIPTNIKTEDKIKEQIEELCGKELIDSFIGSKNTILQGYKDEYKSVDDLKESLKRFEEEKRKKVEQLNSLDEIPVEFQEIDDPEEYDKKLNKRIEEVDQDIEEHRIKLNESERKLGDKSAEEYAEELVEKEELLELKKTEYKHWMNIYNVFHKLKEQSMGNPVEGIENKFREYIDIITDGSVKLHSMGEKMDVQLESGTNELTYDNLSEGTRDTISLAFRLAMLEHLFPEGDGLAVFDDPFTDMDEGRTKLSCELIERFAQSGNQVIFATCDSKYKSLMKGNVIDF